VKALTLWQPMAHAVVHLGKTVENRPHVSPWKTATNTTVAIHAARRSAWNQDYADLVAVITGRRLTPADVQFSAVIGTAIVTDVHWATTPSMLTDECCDPWGFDSGAHVILDAVRACRPIPIGGALGLWTVPAGVELELTEAVRR